MLNRRHIRIKVIQSIYGFSFQKDEELARELNFYFKSIKGTIDFFYFYVALFAAFKMVSTRYSNQKNKSFTREELHRFNLINNNPYLEFIIKNPNLNQEKLEFYTNFWDIESVTLEKIYHAFAADSLFDEYCAEAVVDVNVYHKFINKFFKKFLVENEVFYSLIKDQNLTWIDDFPFINTFFHKQLKKIKLHDSTSFLLPTEELAKEEVLFGKELIEKTINENAFLEEEINKKTLNWQFKRIANLDLVLLKVAISEFLYFSDIPPKTTITEYIEISREYSTPKSNQFINGILDRLMADYKVNNMLIKKGKGLL